MLFFDTKAWKMVDERKVGILDSSLNLDPSFRIGDRSILISFETVWRISHDPSKPIARPILDRKIDTPENLCCNLCCPFQPTLHLRRVYFLSRMSPWESKRSLEIVKAHCANYLVVWTPLKLHNFREQKCHISAIPIVEKPNDVFCAGENCQLLSSIFWHSQLHCQFNIN